MKIILTILLSIYMSVIARASGGGLFAEKVNGRLPEALFSLPIAIVGAYLSGNFWLVPVYWGISYLAMETGHGTFYKMKGYDDHNRNKEEDGWLFQNVTKHLWKLLGWKEESFGSESPRVQTLERIFRPLFEKLGGDITKTSYSWYMMAIKGFLIAIPLGIIPAALNAFLWPLAYYLGFTVLDNPAAPEWISGAFVGVLLAVLLLI